ncbi:AAEL014076-PA [Aedes aegypti]|uniref:AAEL014076-PA n=1 Tax=Aedes aegypti TaxID=7159 RepID=Q16HC5_AEDAE|nr:AAEL014076-PA [Aedes aegypti]
MDTQEANPPVAECASAGDQYHQLLALDKQDLVRNEEPNPCNLCDAMTPAGSGVVLFKFTGCPFPNARYECVGNLEQRELEALLNAEEYQLLMKRRQNSLKSISDSLQKERTDSLPAELKLLVTLTDSCLVPNAEPFECPICYGEFGVNDGVTLHDCFHCFCRECLANSIKHAQDVEVRCPFKDRNASCETVIQDQEIRSLLSEHDYSVYLKRSLEQAEISITGAFHCKTPNCLGWCILEIQDSVTVFQCPICSAQNCLLCEAVHTGMNCEEYNERLNIDYESHLSVEEIDRMIATHTAMRCHNCRFVLTKDGGCDNIICGHLRLTCSKQSLFKGF